MSISDPQKLFEALQEFELNLDTPCVPGELVRWVGSVRQSFDNLDGFLRRQLDEVHPAQLSEIGKEDPGLLARVQHLQETDQELSRQLDKLKHRVEQLSLIAPKAEPDEARLREQLTKFVDDGLWFVVQVRKQETAISTWLQEAFDRDRGTVD